MANQLDEVMQDKRDDDGNPLRRAYTFGDENQPVDSIGGNNALTMLSQPAPKPKQQWTMDDLTKGLQAIRDYVAGNAEGVNNLAKKFTSYDRQFTEDVLNLPATIWNNPSKTNEAGQRFMGGDNWLTRMVKSGTTLPGDVMSGAEPMTDPATGRTSEHMIERAQDMAGLAGGGALTAKPGAGTLGSGPVRKPVPRKAIEEFQILDQKIRSAPPADTTGWTAVPDPHMTKNVSSIPGQENMAYWGVKDADGKLVQMVAAKTPEQAVEIAANVAMRRQGITPQELSRWAGLGDKHGLHGEFEPSPRISLAPKSTILNSDTSKPGAAIAAVASSGPAPVFYSALEHAATNAAQDVMSPQQWLGYLKNQPGVKAEELAWTGLPEWLEAQKGKIKKEDVQGYLDEHKVEIKDVVKGGMSNDAIAKHIEEWIDDRIDNYRELSGGKEPTLEQVQDMRREIAEEVQKHPHDYMTGVTKYSEYQLPGGENYREHLLTMPLRTDTSKWITGPGLEKGTYYVYDGTGKNITDMSIKANSPAEAIEMVAMGHGRAFSEPRLEYKSSHWDEPNVLAHVRTNDRTIDGQKSLHIEEIQSDWHQQGRKQGYQRKQEKLYDMGGLTAKQENQPNHNRWTVRDATGRELGDARAATAEEAIGGFNRPGQNVRDSGVPDAPFKTMWPELALKRMIRKASEEGYDRISWTPGEAQAARYDLSKSLDAVNVTRRGNGNYDIQGTSQSRNHDLGSDIPEAKLAEYVGKDLAEKIVKPEEFTTRDKAGANGDKLVEIVDASGKVRGLAEKGNQKQIDDQIAAMHKHRKFEGVDLKVGGEGMREFYDKMLPKMAEKIGKAHGVKVKQTDIEGNANLWAGGPENTPPKRVYDVLAEHDPAIKEQYPTVSKFVDHWNRLNSEHRLDLIETAKTKGTQPIHYFDLPQSLKDHAIGKGFPLYMSGIPFPLTPVDHDPFEKKK